MHPPISVLVLCFNAEDFIKSTIASIQNQTFRNFEAILVDDGSSDNTLNKLEESINGDPRFTIIPKTHSGILDSLEVGLKHCHGDWIARLGHDDLMHPQRLECQYYFAQKHHDTILFSSEFINFSDNNTPADNIPSKENWRTSKLAANIVTEQQLIDGDTIGEPSVLINSAALKRVNGYDGRYLYAEDYELWLRLGSQGKIRQINGGLTLRRIHRSNISRNRAGTQLFSAAVARASYTQNKERHIQQADKVGLEQLATKFHLRTKTINRYQGEILAALIKDRKGYQALRRSLRILTTRPVWIFSVLKYAIRHLRTGTVLKSWADTN